MNAMFQNLMGQATRLTAQGDLQAATRAIQEALGRAAAHAQQPMPFKTAGNVVIDVEAREIHVPAGVPASAPDAAQQPKAPGQGSVVRGTFSCAAGQRDWRLYVPPTYNGEPLPLVVMLHGCTQDPDDFAAGTGMDDAARRQGFFVLYPAQAQSANPQRCWNWFKHNHQQRGRGEPAVLAGLTREVMGSYAIDPRRVYVAGLSAGGAMAAILGDTYPDLFAAVGVHSGLAAGAANDLPSALAAMRGGSSGQASPIPTIVFHGDQDHTVHPVNAKHIIAACTERAANDEAIPASEERARSANGKSYTRRLHADASGTPWAEHWEVHGAGHAWSGGTPRGSYTDATGPDATAEMVRFFFAHAKA